MTDDPEYPKVTFAELNRLMTILKEELGDNYMEIINKDPALLDKYRAQWRNDIDAEAEGGPTVRMMSLKVLQSMTPISQEQLQATAKSLGGEYADTIKELLKHGKLYSSQGLEPVYLYDAECGLFTVSSYEYINNKLH